MISTEKTILEIVQLVAKKLAARGGSSSIHGTKTDYSLTSNSPAERILFLQRTIGNQTKQRLIKSGSFLAKLRIGLLGIKYEEEN